jgi:phosphoglycolate phosphatase-like HAD superfamily hydrolase
MIQLITFDLDGTLADASKRLIHLQSKPNDWKAFFTGIENDDPIRPMVRLYRMLQDQPNTIMTVASGRNAEQAEPETTRWLAKHGLLYDRMYLRKKNDFRPDFLIKVEMIEEMVRKYGKPPDMIFEDKAEVIAAYRGLGLYVVDVNQGDGEDWTHGIPPARE